MSDAQKIVGHAALAATFFFCFQRFVMGADLQVSIIWSVAAALGAGYLAYSQSRRGR